MGAIQAAGGTTIAQSPDTCVVDSMPRSAIERGFVTRVVSLSGIATILQARCAADSTEGNTAGSEPVPENSVRRR